MFADRLELSGIGWTGLYRRTLRLDDVARVEWWSTQGRELNLALYLHDDSVVSLWVPGPGLWKFAIEAHAKRLRPDRIEERPVPLPAA